MSILVLGVPSGHGQPFVRVEAGPEEALAFVNGSGRQHKTGLWDSIVPGAEGREVPFEFIEDDGVRTGLVLEAPYRVALADTQKKVSTHVLVARTAFALGGIHHLLTTDPEFEPLRDLAPLVALPDAADGFTAFVAGIDRMVQGFEQQADEVARRMAAERPGDDKDDNDRFRICSPFCCFGVCCD